MPQDAAIGLRVKSGRATAVLVAGAAQSPQALDRRSGRDAGRDNDPSRALGASRQYVIGEIAG